MSELQLKSVLAFWKLYFSMPVGMVWVGIVQEIDFVGFLLNENTPGDNLFFKILCQEFQMVETEPFLNLKVPNVGKSTLFIFPCLNSNTFERQIVHMGLFRFPNSRLYRD